MKIKTKIEVMDSTKERYDMSDAPIVPTENDETKTEEKKTEPLSDGGKKAIQGVPLDDETRMGLYKLKNEGADLKKFGEFTQTLPKEEFEKLQKSGSVSGEATTITDVKGGEDLVFTDSSEREVTENKSAEAEE